MASSLSSLGVDYRKLDGLRRDLTECCCAPFLMSDKSRARFLRRSPLDSLGCPALLDPDFFEPHAYSRQYTSLQSRTGHCGGGRWLAGRWRRRTARNNLVRGNEKPSRVKNSAPRRLRRRRFFVSLYRYRQPIPNACRRRLSSRRRCRSWATVEAIRLCIRHP